MPQSLARENRILSALLEVSRVLNSSFDLEKNLFKTMRAISDFLEMERGSVFLLDRLSKELKIVAAHGLTKEQMARGKYRIGEGIVGRVLEKATPLVIPNLGEEPLFLNKTGARIEKSGISFLCVPITFKGEPIGVLSADKLFRDNDITVDEDIRVLEIVASIIGHIYDVDLLEGFVKKNEVEIGIICTPKEVAQDMADMLTNAGVKGIWNFAPIDIRVPDDVIVENVHLSESLFILSYLLNEKEILAAAKKK